MSFGILSFTYCGRCDALIFLWLNLDNKGCKPREPALPFNFSIHFCAWSRSVSGTCVMTSDLLICEKMPQQAHKPVCNVSSPSFYVEGIAKCPNKPVQILNICLYNLIFCDLWLSLSLSSCDTSAVNMSCGGKKGEKIRMKTLPGEQILPLLHLTAALNLALNDKVTLRRTSAEAGTIFMRNVRQKVWLPRVINQGAVHACHDLWELSVPTVSMKC